MLYLKNVGNGPATNILFQVDIESTTTKYNAFFMNQNAKVTANSIRPNDTAALSIDITNSKKAPRKDDITWLPDCPIGMYDETRFKTPESFVIRLRLCYDDLMLNHFVQELKFEVCYYLVSCKDKDSYYHCDVNLKDIGTPTITRAHL